jgi:hypothetical protein
LPRKGPRALSSSGNMARMERSISIARAEGRYGVVRRKTRKVVVPRASDLTRGDRGR